LKEPDLYTLSPADMVLHSAAHLFHDGDLNLGIRDVVDIGDLLAAYGEDPAFWAGLVPRARELDLARPLFYALRYAADLLEADIPESVQAEAKAGAPMGPSLQIMDRLVPRVLLPSLSDRPRPCYSSDPTGCGCHRDCWHCTSCARRSSAHRANPKFHSVQWHIWTFRNENGIRAVGSDGLDMAGKTEAPENTGTAGRDEQAPVPKRRAVLLAAASAPVILTLMAGPAHAIYSKDGEDYFPGLSRAPDCDVAPPEPPRYRPDLCDDPPGQG
jgi:hypothetical protein